MKPFFFFRYPVQFSVIFGILAMILSINSLQRGDPWSLLSTLVLVVIYFNLMKFGENLTKQKKLLILLFGILVIAISTGYAFYLNGSLW